ncbi:MAG: polysaccharide biosynthesis tyrosine autokinase [Pirellulales bacterium]
MAPFDPNSDPGDLQQDTNDHGAAADTDSGGNGNGAHSEGGTLSTIDSRLPSVPTLNWSYGPPPRPEILSAKPNPLELMHAVRRRWALALGLGLSISGIAAGILWFLLPVKYEAYALLKVSGKPPAVLDKASAAAEEFAVFKRTQVQLILSQLVLNGTLREQSINRLSMVHENNDDQVAWLKGQLVIDYPDDAEIMRIAMKGKKRNEVLLIVDKVVDVYMREIVQHDKQMRMENEDELRKAYERQVTVYQKELDALRTLEVIHKTSGSHEAQVKKQMATLELENLVRKRDDFKEALGDIDMEIMLFDARAEKPSSTRPPDAIVDAGVADDPILYQLTQRAVALNDMLNQVRSAASKPESSPAVRGLQRQILDLDESIDERRGQLRPRLLDMLAAKKSEREKDRYPMEKEHLQAQRKFLQGQFDAADVEVQKNTDIVSKMESFSAQVAAKQEELNALQAIKKELGGKLDVAGVERLAPDRITKVDAASIADSSGDAVRKYVAVSFTLILSFSLVVLGVAVVEFQARKVNSVKEVNDGLGIRVVGELPSITGRAFRRVKGGKGQAVLKALMAERIDGTRTALIHTTAIDPPRVVMITSAEPREGKTTTCSQLAASLARSGRRTLLIDADIRNPGVHRVFEMPQDPGLCELLRGEAERDAVIHPTRTANLWLMPAGRCDLRSVQALSSTYLGTAIAALSVQFDYIIIDSGPVLKVADALLVGQHVDAAIVSALRDVSRVPNVYDAVERLRSVGITVLGSVVNGVKDDTARHGVELLMAETPKKAEAETTATT